MKLPLAPVAAAGLGLAVALGVGVLPTALLEAGVMRANLPAVIAAAEPPLGMTARAMLALGAGAFAALASWIVLSMLLGARTLSLGEADSADADTEMLPMPVIRRADAHPDAPPRPPLLATRDLGEPTIMAQIAQEAPPASAVSPAEQALPADLDQPLAAFDPQAIPEVPRAPSVPLAPLHRDLHAETPAPDEQPEIRGPAMPLRPAPLSVATADSQKEASIQALLDRLERGVARRSPAPAPTPAPAPVLAPAPAPASNREGSLEETLAALRNLARPA